MDPNELEGGFASLETQIAPVLRWVVRSRRFPTDPEQMGLLLHLPALNAARPPAAIERIEDIVDQTYRAGIVENLTPERHSALLQDWTPEGRDPTHIEDLEALKTRISGGSIRVSLERDQILFMMLSRSAHLVDLFFPRRWSLLVADGTKEFICCDNPVFLVNNQNLPADTPTRFDDPRFDVIMPLARQMCLVGHHSGLGGVSFKTSNQTVGFINHMTEAAAQRYVYSAREAYPYSIERGPGENTESYRRDLSRAIPNADLVEE